MSLDIRLSATVETTVHDGNITHNLTEMALQLGVYHCLWRAPEMCIERAEELIKPLRWAIEQMHRDPERFKAYDAANGWGTYDDFLPWLQKLLESCERYPSASVEIYR